MVNRYGAAVFQVFKLKCAVGDIRHRPLAVDDELVDDAAAHAVAPHQRFRFRCERTPRHAVDAQRSERHGFIRGNQEQGDVVECGSAFARVADRFDAHVKRVAAMLVRAFHA
ncbi:hypothetical protein PSAC2689_60204 [Paraburkholderia sacchari]